MYQAVIDYDPGMHGHFLEYICNRYIFSVSVSNSPFFKTGSSHAINLDSDYQQTKQVNSEHYTSYNLPIVENKVIYVKHNSKFDLVLLNNIFYRCYSDDTGGAPLNDLDPDFILKWHLGNITDNINVKEDLFAKLMERTHFQPEFVAHPGKQVFYFDFGSFFNLSEFLLELQRLSQWLDQILITPPELIEDWQKFVGKNQGYQTYCRVSHLVEKILLGHNEPIEDDFFIHAGINVCLAQMARVYEEELHSSKSYPTDTQQIYNIVCRHFREYDTKFK